MNNKMGYNATNLIGYKMEFSFLISVLFNFPKFCCYRLWMELEFLS